MSPQTHHKRDGSDLSKNRASHPGARKKQIEIDMRENAQVNDNLVSEIKRRFFTLPRVILAGTVIAVGTIALLNISNIAAFAAFHASDHVLSHAMDISPEAVAFSLNAISPK